MKKTIVTGALFCLLLGATPVLAQQFCDGSRCAYIPLEQLPGQVVDPTRGVNFVEYLTNAFRILIILGGMFAIATFVFGGVAYMTSEVVDKKGWAKTQMQRALYGILLLLGSYILLYTLNPDLVDFSRFAPENLRRTSTPGTPQAPTTLPQTLPSASTENNALDQCLNRTITGQTQCALSSGGQCNCTPIIISP